METTTCGPQGLMHGEETNADGMVYDRRSRPSFQIPSLEESGGSEFLDPLQNLFFT